MKKLLIIFGIISMLTSCSSLDVYYDSDQSVDIGKFKTFSFYPWDWKHGFQINEYDKQTILMALQEDLEGKGYKYMKEGGELAVSIFLTLEGKVSYEAYTNHYGGWAGYGGGWGYSGFGYGYGYGSGYGTTTVTKRNYAQGTLIIDVFSIADKKLIWQGIGSKEIEHDLEKRDRTLPKNVARIMANFPKSN